MKHRGAVCRWNEWMSRWCEVKNTYGANCNTKHTVMIVFTQNSLVRKVKFIKKSALPLFSTGIHCPATFSLLLQLFLFSCNFFSCSATFPLFLQIYLFPATFSLFLQLFLIPCNFSSFLANLSIPFKFFCKFFSFPANLSIPFNFFSFPANFSLSLQLFLLLCNGLRKRRRSVFVKPTTAVASASDEDYTLPEIFCHTS